MKVVFVYPDLLEGAAWRGYYYSGIGILAAVLEQAGHQAALLHVTQPISREPFQERLGALLPAAGPRLVGFSITSNMVPFLREWSSWIKERWPDALVVAGGVHPTLVPEETLSIPSVDLVCVGEGEGAIVELATALQENRPPAGIDNLWWKRPGGSIEPSPLRPLVDLDTLPFPDRRIYDYPNLHHERQGEATMMVSRGCPYRCTYCCNEALRQVYRGLGQPVRFRSVPLVIAELRQVLADYPFIRRFVFDDDILPLRKDWFRQFAQVYRQEIGRPFACNLRPNLADEEIVGLLKEAGCDEVRFGIESGNDEMRNGLLNRQLSRQEIIRAFDLCHRAGMKVFSFNIVGFPGETVQQMLDTVKLNAAVRADVTRVTIFYPYQRTRLHEISREQGLLTDRIVSDYATDTVLGFDKVQRNRVVFIRRYFPVLARLYRWARRLPRFVERWLDAFLSARWTTVTLFYAANKLYDWVRGSAALDRWAMALRRRFFG
jgi:anaerobic magnesium-protoporphyrin IX monomethyl ester cyclase